MVPKDDQSQEETSLVIGKRVLQEGNSFLYFKVPLVLPLTLKQSILTSEFHEETLILSLVLLYFNRNVFKSTVLSIQFPRTKTRKTRKSFDCFSQMQAEHSSVQTLSNAIFPTRFFCRVRHKIPFLHDKISPYVKI